MPAIVGVINLNSVGSSGVFHVGDVYMISPLSNAKTFAGSGSFNTGNGMSVYNHQSATNTTNLPLVDQPIAGNF
ncbi:MAG: spore germination protein [Bacilli bacterium]